MTERTASCSCGQLTAKVSGDPIRVSICHCYACQIRTGSVFAAQARFPREAVKISGKSSQYVRVGDGGGRVHFSFCPTCAATVHFYLEGHEASIAIPVGAFADRSFPPPVFSMYEDRKHEWVEVPANAEHRP
ncbi:aldehyde-activating protein [Betaproteobacteria bacterium GR16-43]|nr:aldehyde-activating protein [Betaproteobacteria bacterium GR16-43]